MHGKFVGKASHFKDFKLPTKIISTSEILKQLSPGFCGPSLSGNKSWLHTTTAPFPLHSYNKMLISMGGGGVHGRKISKCKTSIRNVLKINLEYSDSELSTMTNFEREAFPPNLVPHMSNAHAPVFFSTRLQGERLQGVLFYQRSSYSRKGFDCLSLFLTQILKL